MYQYKINQHPFIDFYLAIEGFSSDIFEFSDSKILISDQTENQQQQQQQQTDCSSINFSAIASSTDRDSPPPISKPSRKIYGIQVWFDYFNEIIKYIFHSSGPPQLSTMLSVSDALDSPFETPLDTLEDAIEYSSSKKSESLNIQRKKGLENKTLIRNK